MKIILIGERPISWNTFYAGKHWTYRRILAEDIHQKVFLTLKAKFGRKPIPQITYKVKIKITAFYKKTHIDSDNIPAKIYIDGLKGSLIPDDDPRYVGPVTTLSCKAEEGEKERVEIDITKYSL
mgnify:CR=1 FL=1